MEPSISPLQKKESDRILGHDERLSILGIFL